VEALAIVDELDTEKRTRAYTVTGGSVTRHLRGEDEGGFYVKYPRAINERFPNRWISKLVIQALTVDQLRPFKDAGVQIYHPNYEVWDPKLFREICPGKEDYVGRDEWIRRIVDAAEIFGPSQVIPNFVGGVEMAKSVGFQKVDDALDSNAEAFDFFMSKGITPRFTVWCPEPLAVLGNEEGPAPLAYHMGLLKLWRDTHKKYNLPTPPGYGPPGAGNAVFSVSSFMDVIDPDCPLAELPPQ
ncbi:MAG: radical SAM protein, partial [Planctomycetota bacterium]